MTPKFQITTGFLLVAMIASAAQARDGALLNKVAAEAREERVGLEKEYKNNEAMARAATRRNDLRAIEVELGDELGAESGRSDQLKFSETGRPYREKAIAKKLDREWKEVNRSFEQANREIKPERSRR